MTLRHAPQTAIRPRKDAPFRQGYERGDQNYLRKLPERTPSIGAQGPLPIAR